MLWNILSDILYFAVVIGFTHWHLRYIDRTIRGSSFKDASAKASDLLKWGLGLVLVVGLLVALCLWQWSTIIVTVLAVLHYMRMVDLWSTESKA